MLRGRADVGSPAARRGAGDDPARGVPGGARRGASGEAGGAAGEARSAAAGGTGGAAVRVARGTAAVAVFGAARAVFAAAGRHRVFAGALGAGAALRALAELGYHWAIWFNDSFDYLAIALSPRPDPMRPIGYPILLWLLKPLHSFAVVTTLQHLLGLGTAVLMYALLRERFGLPGWGATLATVPVLFDAFQIQLEHLLLADTLFTFLAVAATVALCWRAAGGPGSMNIWRAALAGTLLAMAAITRPVAVALILMTICYLAACRAGWRAITALCATACAPLAGYVLWFHAISGRLAFDSTDGIYLWGRTAAFADCGVIKPPPDEAWLCPRLPVPQRAASSSQVWQPTSPFRWRHGQVFSTAENDLALRFALRAIAAQPGAYAKTVLTSTGRAFTWARTSYPTGYTASLYTFAGAKTWLPDWPEPDGRSAAAVARAYADGHATTVTAAPYAGFVRWYQRYFYLRGPLLAVILIVPPTTWLAVVGLRIRRRRRTTPGPLQRRRVRPAAPDPADPATRHPAIPTTGPATGPAVPATRHPTVPAARAIWFCWSSAIALLVIPPLTVDFDYRYVLPVVPFGCLAAALAARRCFKAADAVRASRPSAPCGNSGAVNIPTVHEMTRSEG